MLLAFTVPLIPNSYSQSASMKDFQWVQVNGYRNNNWVTLKSFCEFYKFAYESAPQSGVFRSKSSLRPDKTVELVLRLDSREIWINGVKYWLTFSISSKDDQWLISRMDLLKLFDPILRPWGVDSTKWKEWQGVVIDPGHGGEDNGATSRRGKKEKNYTLDLAGRLAEELKALGITKIVHTRKSDVFIPLETRAAKASEYPNYVFVSLHFNDADASARGIETYCLSPKGAGSTDAGGRVTRSSLQYLTGNDNDLVNILLASEVHRQLVRLNPGDPELDRGVRRARFVVLKENQIPSVLVEGGFLSNRMESALIDRAEYRQSLAKAIARGIFSFMNLRKPLVPPVAPPMMATAPNSKPKTSVTTTNTPSTIPKVASTQNSTPSSTVTNQPSITPPAPAATAQVRPPEPTTPTVTAQPEKSKTPEPSKDAPSAPVEKKPEVTPEANSKTPGDVKPTPPETSAPEQSQKPVPAEPTPKSPEVQSQEPEKSSTVSKPEEKSTSP